MIRNILIGLVVLAALAVGAAFLLPQNVHVERSTVVAASPEQVFALVNDMTRWGEWDPWAKLDPDMKVEFKGGAQGVGASRAWTSEKLGNGSMTITESTPFSSVKMALDLDNGGPSSSSFTFDAADGGTKVTWGFDTDAGMNPVMRYMGLMLDKWVGDEYAKGLENLKQVAEAQAKADVAAVQSEPAAAPPELPPLPASADPNKGPEVTTVEAQTVVLTRASADAKDAAAISAALGGAYQKILNYAEKHNLAISGAPLAITVSHDAAGKWTFDAALPLGDAPATAPPEEDGVKISQTYAGKVVKLTHKGAYTTMAQSYDRIAQYMKANNLKEGATSWEEYVTDPVETPEEEQLTNIYYVVKE